MSHRIYMFFIIILHLMFGYCSDGCAAENTSVPKMSKFDKDIFILWPETNIGINQSEPCPCGNLIGDDFVMRRAYRYCGGDFTNGAMWQEPRDRECEFSPSARQLCLINTVRIAFYIYTH